jgi:hypothetical protein
VLSGECNQTLSKFLRRERVPPQLTEAAGKKLDEGQTMGIGLSFG